MLAASFEMVFIRHVFACCHYGCMWEALARKRQACGRLEDIWPRILLLGLAGEVTARRMIGVGAASPLGRAGPSCEARPVRSAE